MGSLKTKANAVVLVFFLVGLLVVWIPASAEAAVKVPFGSKSVMDWYTSRYSRSAVTANPSPQPAPAPQPVPTPQPQPIPQPDPNHSASPNWFLNPDEEEMLNLINQERVKNGLSPFQLDPLLSKLARMKSQDMKDNNYFGHTSPTYGSALDMEKAAGIRARVMGAENLAKSGTVYKAHIRLMASSGHRSNILDPQHTSIGIGIVRYPYGVIVTQLFIGE